VDASTEALERLVRRRGMCRGRDTEAWYPTVGCGGNASTVSDSHARTERTYAAGLCAGCPVRVECLELAFRIPAGQYGVWGGTSERERRAMLRARHQADRATAGAVA
jgi:hypothetical protein